MLAKIGSALFLFAAFSLTVARAQGPAVTEDRLLHAAAEPQNWLSYSGTYDGWRYSRLDQITPQNATQLSAQWVFQTGVPGKFETSPLVVDGIMYVTAADNHAFALDARTGRSLWHYQRNLPEKLRVCCGRVNRGFAILGDTLFLATLDAHVIALDSFTGAVLWDVPVADYTKGYSFTVAPLVVKDKVIVGVSGGEYGIRGFIDAYDAKSGQRLWRFNTVPAPGEPGHDSWAGDSWTRGGAPAWLTGSYDPELNLLFWPTGNPAPSDDGSGRKGDNLYSNSMLALDPDSGKLKWHFQFTPWDLHDWDATEIPVLLDLQLAGKPQKTIVQANRNGFLYVLDRATGKFLSAAPYARQTWAKGIDASGRPIPIPGREPGEKGIRTCPGAAGATNFMAPSFSPQTQLLYVTTREQCDVFTASPQRFEAGRVFIGSMYMPATGEKDWGAIRAIDPVSGKVKWEYREYSASWGGNLSTAGGVVFTGDVEGYFIALDAASGRELWHFQTGAPIYASPVSYQLDGRQYIAIPSAGNLYTFALPAPKP